MSLFWSRHVQFVIPGTAGTGLSVFTMREGDGSSFSPASLFLFIKSWIQGSSPPAASDKLGVKCISLPECRGL